MKLECTACGAYWHAHTEKAKKAAVCLCGAPGKPSKHRKRPKEKPKSEAACACLRCCKRFTQLVESCPCGGPIAKRRKPKT